MHTTHLSPEAQFILFDVKRACEDLNVYLELTPGENVYDGNGTPSSGFFSDEALAHKTGLYVGHLACAAGGDEKQWIPILVHEFHHMIQWAEGCAAWQNVKGGRHLGDKISDLFAWVEGQLELDSAYVAECAQAAMWVEADCELRTVQYLEATAYPVSLEEYQQKAASYVLFYHVVELYRKWYHPDRKPYNLPEVWGLFAPEDLNDRGSRSVEGQTVGLPLTVDQLKALRSCT